MYFCMFFFFSYFKAFAVSVFFSSSLNIFTESTPTPIPNQFIYHNVRLWLCLSVWAIGRDLEPEDFWHESASLKMHFFGVTNV